MYDCGWLGGCIQRGGGFFFTSLVVRDLYTSLTFGRRTCNRSGRRGGQKLPLDIYGIDNIELSFSIGLAEENGGKERERERG